MLAKILTWISLEQGRMEVFSGGFGEKCCPSFVGFCRPHAFLVSQLCSPSFKVAISHTLDPSPSTCFCDDSCNGSHLVNICETGLLLQATWILSLAPPVTSSNIFTGSWDEVLDTFEVPSKMLIRNYREMLIKRMDGDLKADIKDKGELTSGNNLSLFYHFAWTLFLTDLQLSQAYESQP